LKERLYANGRRLFPSNKDTTTTTHRRQRRAQRSSGTDPPRVGNTPGQLEGEGQIPEAQREQRNDGRAPLAERGDVVSGGSENSGVAFVTRPRGQVGQSRGTAHALGGSFEAVPGARDSRPRSTPAEKTGDEIAAECARRPAPRRGFRETAPAYHRRRFGAAPRPDEAAAHAANARGGPGRARGGKRKGRAGGGCWCTSHRLRVRPAKEREKRARPYVPETDGDQPGLSVLYGARPARGGGAGDRGGRGARA